jgi:hypothetical protein
MQNLRPNGLNADGMDEVQQEYYFNGMYTLDDLEMIIMRIRSSSEYNPNSWINR